MKRAFLSIIILITALAAMAQATQPCVVKQYNQKQQKTPLAGVQVEVRDAGSAASGSDGRLMLSFRTLKPGDRVPFRAATKAGYELMNKTAVEQWNISRNQQPFEIVLVQSSYFTQLKSNLKQSSVDSYHQKYEQTRAELEKLKKEGKLKEQEYYDKLNELEDRYDSQLKNLDTYVDQFARIDLSELSEQEQQFIELAHAGRLDEAAEAYLTLNAAGKYITAVENVRRLNEDIAKLEDEKAQQQEAAKTFFAMLQRQVNTLKLAGGEENYKKAGELLKRAALADTTGIDAVWEYANFAYGQRDFKEAERFYLICLGGCGEDLLTLSDLQNHLGNLYRETLEYKKAEDYYQKAFTCRLELYAQYPDTYRNKVAASQNNLGNLYWDIHNYTNSEDYYLKALENYTILFKQDSNAYRWNLASVQNNIGNLYKTIQRIDYSEKYYLEALENRSILFTQDPDAFRPDLAMTQGNIGVLYIANHDYAKAEEYLLKALENYFRLVKYNPDAFRFYLARTQENLGLLYSNLHDNVKAEKYYLQALENLTLLFAQNPDAYRAELAVTQSSLGNLYFELHDYTKAEEYYLQALENRTLLFAQDPDANRADLAMAFNNLGNSYVVLLNYGKAEECYLMALEHGTQLFSMKPDAYRANLAMFQDNIGYLYYILKDYSKAEDFLLKALGNRYQLLNQDSIVYRADCSVTLYKLGDLYLSMSDYDKAENYYLKALKEYTQLFLNNPDVYRVNMATIQKNLGDLFNNKNDYVKALEFYLISLENYGHFSALGSDDYLSNEADLQKKIGIIYYLTEDTIMAEQYCLKSLENYILLFDKEPNVYRGRLAEIQWFFTIFYEGSDMEKHDMYLNQALENYEILYQSDSTYKDDVVNAYKIKGVDLLSKGMLADGVGYLEAASRMDAESTAPYLALAYNGQAYEYAKGDNFSKALETINRAIALMPEEAYYYDSKGEILLMMGDKQEAVKMWQKVLELDPDFLKKYEGGTELYKQLKEKGLIE